MQARPVEMYADAGTSVMIVSQIISLIRVKLFFSNAEVML